MTGNEQSQLRFDISEKVTFHREQPEIETLLSLDLVPEVHIEDLGANVMIQGAIRLTGKYLDRSDDKMGQRLDEQLASEKIEYVVPVEITLPSERVKRLDAITAEIQSFDYDLLSSRELWIEAVLVIDGLELGQIDQSTSVTFATEETDQALVTEYDETGKELKENEEIPEDGITVPFEDAFYPPIIEDERTRQVDEQGEEGAAQNDNQKEIVEQTKEDDDREETASAPLKGEQSGTQEVNTVEAPEAAAEVAPHETSEKAFSEEASKEAKEVAEEERKAEQETIIHFQKKEEKSTPHDMRGDADAARELTESSAATLEPADESNESIPDMEYESSAQEQETETTGEPPEDHSGEWTAGSAFEWIKQKLRDEGDQFHRLKMVIVQKDETLEHIAERYEMTSVELLQVNQLESGELQQGQIVYIPVKLS